MLFGFVATSRISMGKWCIRLMADNLTKSQRSYCMSRVRTRDTGIEVRVRSALHRIGLRFRKHVATLPGKPDIVFAGVRVAVFVDGDFWHGWKFPSWRHRVSPFWREKIEKNRRRDRRTFRKLRRAGWCVIRIWQHDCEDRLDKAVSRIQLAVATRSAVGSIDEGEVPHAARHCHSVV